MNVRALRRLQNAFPNDALLLTAAYQAKDEDAWRYLVFNSTTGFTITLPKATGSGKMLEFAIGKTLSSGSNIVVTASGDFIAGGVWVAVTGGTASRIFQANGTSNTTLTMNGGSTGGQLGDTIRYYDVLSGVWFLEGVLIGSSASSPIS